MSTKLVAGRTCLRFCYRTYKRAPNHILHQNAKTQEIRQIDYAYFLSEHAARRRSSITRELTKLHYTEAPNAISLAEGMPNELTFPFAEIHIVLKGGEKVHLQGTELGAALQYIPSQGFPPLVEKLKEFTCRVHQPPNWEGSELLITNGSQDGISKSIEMCIEEGDPILVQNPIYAGTECILKPYKAELLGIEQDENGIIPEHIRNILEEREMQCAQNGALKMPKLLYINPTGANPTGTTLPNSRRKEIYQIACQYNLIILEDDPYHFMHFLDRTPESFLSLDTEGRVMRFDSFSKVLTSGLRLGWVTGPRELVAPIELHIQSSYLHSSTLSQVLINKLLNSWGFDKLMEHFEFVRTYYKARRDYTLAAMSTHLSDLADWAEPSAGMFVWIRVDGVSDVYEMLTKRGLLKNIIFVPGHAFMVNPDKPCNYIRASYSKATPEHIDEAMRKLAELIREEKELHPSQIKSYT